MRHSQCCRDRNRRDEIRQQVSRQNAPPARAESLRGGHEFRVLQRKNLTSDDAAKPEPAGQAKEENQRAHRQVGPGHQDAEQQQKSWYREKRVEQAHHHCIHQSAHVSRDRSVGDAQGQTDDCRQHADSEGKPRAVDDATQHISAVRIGAEGMRERGRQILEHHDIRLRGGVVRRDERSQQTDEQNDTEGERCRLRRALAQDCAHAERERRLPSPRRTNGYGVSDRPRHRAGRREDCPASP